MLFRSQIDLALVAKSSGLLIYANRRFHGIVAQRPDGLASSVTASDAASATDWQPVLDGETLSGNVAAGTVIAGFAPSNAFSLEVDGRPVTRRTVLGWAAGYDTPAGNATIVLHQFPLNGLLALFTIFLWLTYLFGFGVTERLGELLGRRQRRIVTPVEIAAAIPVIELDDDEDEQ